MDLFQKLEAERGAQPKPQTVGNLESATPVVGGAGTNNPPDTTAGSTAGTEPKVLTTEAKVETT